MAPPKMGPICPSCLFTVATRLTFQNARQPWAGQPHRFFSGKSGPGSRARGLVPRNGPPSRASGPSRMVLSDRVARSPNGRNDRGRDAKKPKQETAGPFRGMNQRFAGGLSPRSPPSSSNAPGRSAPRDKRGKSDDRRTKAMKMHNSLSEVPYGQRSRIKRVMEDVESFDQLDLLPSIKEAISSDVLKGMTNLKPTPVQRLAIPALLGQSSDRALRRSLDLSQDQRQEFLLAAETGSGKTLAYMLPIADALKKAEEADPEIVKYKEYFSKQMEAMRSPDYTGPREFEPHPTTARPKAVVLVPTAELVDQVGAVAKKISHVVKFKSARLSASVSAKVISRDLYSPGGVDLVVTTPHLLSSIAETDPNILSRISHLVVDEADSLFDRSFSPVTMSILDRALPSVKQLVLCSATIPKRLDNYLDKEFPQMHRITTPTMHAIPRRVQMGVIDTSKDPYRHNKNLACADAIWSIGKDAAKHEGSVPGEIDVKRIMVFVNEREKTQEVADYLVTKGIDAVALHRDTSVQRQSEMLASFTRKEPLMAQVEDEALHRGKRSLPNTKVIVATDLASRGIDTLAVRHVVLYDVPHTTIDFIHRLGRAGRMGRRGRGIVLVGKDDRRDIVAEVRESMFHGQALI